MVFQLEKGPERIQLFFTSPSPYALFKNLPEEERKNSILIGCYLAHPSARPC
jgi:hypothetical protein